MDDVEKDLQPSSGDYIHTISKAGLSSIPLIGSAVAELFNMIISPPLEKRRNEWLINLSSELKELEEKVDCFTIEDLSDNDLFLSVVMQATQIALKNHQEEKLHALRNAIINTALNINIDEVKQLMFLNMINDLSVWHLKILHYFGNPNKRFDEKQITKPNLLSGSPSVALLVYYPELKKDDEFLKIIVKDLYNNGLLSIDSLGGRMTESGIYAGKATKYGNDFIRYITRE